MIYDMKMRSGPIDPYKALSNAIIAQAYDDYVTGDTGPSTDPVYQRQLILEFFRSDLFKMMTDVDPEFLITRMLKEAKPIEPGKRKNKWRY